MDLRGKASNSWGFAVKTGRGKYGQSIGEERPKINEAPTLFVLRRKSRCNYCSDGFAYI
jgi:hypothetical protein